MSLLKIVEANVEESKKLYSEYLSDKKNDILEGSAFMFFALNLIFPEIEIEEIEKGIVDSSYRGEKHDYGIDAMYITANGELVTSSEQLDDYNEDSKFIIHLLQFKKGRGVEQGDMLKFKEGIKRVIIEENNVEKDNRYMFEYLQEFNEIKSQLFGKNFSTNQIVVKIYVVFGGIEKTVEDDNLVRKQIDDILSILTNGGYTNNIYEILGAQKLIETQNRGKEIIDIINYSKSLKYISETNEKKLTGYICIVDASEIAKLVKAYQTALFEANIRDFYRNNDLNKKIFDTAVSVDEAKYFWSYNNGLTITCRKVEELPSDKYKLLGLQIVNGCQTSYSLYHAYLYAEKLQRLNDKIKNGESLSDSESKVFAECQKNHLQKNISILIKIIETKDPDLTYKITETTNSQTPIKNFSLKANENIQKFLEDYLLKHNIYYERRINFYRNKGYKNTVSIQKLFQIYVAQILFKPSQVKTRPKTLFNIFYDEVFPSPEVKTLDFSLYLIPIKIDNCIRRKIRIIQRTKSESDLFNLMLYSYAKLHLGVFLLHAILGKDYDLKGIVKKNKEIIKIVENDTLLSPYFNLAVSNLKKVIKTMTGANKDLIPSIVKKTELDDKIVRFVKRDLHSK